MPKHDAFLPEVVNKGVVHIPVAIRTRENDYSEFHSAKIPPAERSGISDLAISDFFYARVFHGQGENNQLSMLNIQYSITGMKI
jgi:hypothetical protein